MEFQLFLAHHNHGRNLQGVRDYVKDGLHEETLWMYFEDVKDLPNPVWLDYNHKTKKHDYDDCKDGGSRFSLRYLDGLTLNDSIIDECHAIWCEEYKKHSEKLYQETYRQINKPCSPTSHSFDPKDAFCCTAVRQIGIMRHHINFAEGRQSQYYMRNKILNLLADDIDNLPSSNKYKAVSAEIQSQYLHSIAVILFTLADHTDWIGFKVYSSDDFRSFFTAVDRVQFALNNLIRETCSMIKTSTKCSFGS